MDITDIKQVKVQVKNMADKYARGSKPSMLFSIVLYFIFAFTSTAAFAFSTGGCEGDCKKCHSLSNQEVKEILGKLNNSHAKILSIQLSPLKSLWEVTIDDKGKKGIFYIDFSKKFLVPGPVNIIEISTKANKSAETIEKIKEKKKVKTSGIPIGNALAFGNVKARKKVIVFTDPD